MIPLGFASRAAALFCVVAATLCAPVASAQTLPEAERALASRDFERAGAIAEGLLEEGTRAGAELAPIYRVLGLARLGAGDEEAARTALTRWLAFDPSARIDGASDDLRSILMEARGVWASTSSRLGATAELAPDGSGLLVRVSDPASMAARVRVRARVDEGPWVSTVIPPSAVLEVPIPDLASGTRVDYALAFIDEFGNRVWLDGSDEAPLRLLRSTPMTSAATVTPAVPMADATPFHVGGGVLVALSVVSGVIGAITHAERERLAAIYNGDGASCTGAGDTRGGRCGPELAAVSSNETAAIVAYAFGGAALVGGLSLLLAAPSGTTEAPLACGFGPGQIGVACGGSF